MASKVISLKAKQASIERLRATARGEGTATVADEARRNDVSPQAVRGWVRDDKAKNPEAWIPKPKPEAPKDPAGAPAPPVQEEGGVNAALEAIGVTPEGLKAAGIDPPPPIPSRPPEPPQGLPVTPEEDERLFAWSCEVAMTGGTWLGYLIGCGSVRKQLGAPVPIPFAPFQPLCALTDGEKAALRPTAAVLAPTLRQAVGSDRRAAMFWTLFVLGRGMLARTSQIKATIVASVQEAIRTGKVKVDQPAPRKPEPTAAAVEGAESDE